MKTDRCQEARRRALVSDHAIVRYIERVLGSPELIESIVDDLLADNREVLIQAAQGNVSLRVEGRMELTISKGRVVTVVGVKKRK